MDALVEEARKLPASDRIRLVQQVWDSVADESPAAAELGPEQLAELNRRLDRIEREGFHGIPWEELKRELLEKAGR